MMGAPCQVPAAFTPDEMQRAAAMLRHALGAVAHNPRPNWGYRNRYCLQIKSDPADLAAVRKMVSAGLLDQIEVRSPSMFFRATANGMRFVGMSEAEIRRTMDPTR